VGWRRGTADLYIFLLVEDIAIDGLSPEKKGIAVFRDYAVHKTNLNKRTVSA
jgi:hypothetical protein